MPRKKTNTRCTLQYFIDTLSENHRQKQELERMKLQIEELQYEIRVLLKAAEGKTWNSFEDR